MKTVALGELVDFYSGGTPTKAKPEFWQGDVPWFSAKDMKKPRLADSTEHISKKVFSSTSLRKLPAGTIAMVVRGMILAHTVPIAVLDAEAAINQDLKALLPKREVDTSFLAAMLRAQHATILSQVSTAAHGTKKLDSRVLEELRIPYPPLPEQRRIAAILDHADALRAKRRQVRAHLESLTQSIFVKMFSDDPVQPLGEMVDSYSGGTPSKGNASLWDGDLPWFSAKDLKETDLFDSIDHVSQTVLVDTNLRLLPADTVTLVVRGMILAHSFPVSTLRVPATINQDLKALIPRNDIHADFLASALRARKSWVLSRIATAAHGTKKLDSNVLEAIPIPDVDVARQQRFAEVVSSINRRRTALLRATEIDDELFSSLEFRAFRGEL